MPNLMIDGGVQRLDTAKPVAVFGAGGHGLLIGAVLVHCGDKVFFLDDRMDAISRVAELDCMLVGGIEKLEDARFLRRHDLFIGIGDNLRRRVLSELAQANGADLPALIDPSAVVFAGVFLSSGCAVMAGAVVSHGVRLGKSVIINTCASVAHDCVLGDYVNVCDGARLTGGVTVGDMTFIGAGAVILPKVKIGQSVVIGAGSVVTKDIPDGETVAGNPARFINSNREAVFPITRDNLVSGRQSPV